MWTMYPWRYAGKNEVKREKETGFLNNQKPGFLLENQEYNCTLLRRR
jgi:hypothetical protein